MLLKRINLTVSKKDLFDITEANPKQPMNVANLVLNACAHRDTSLATTRLKTSTIWTLHKHCNTLTVMHSPMSIHHQTLLDTQTLSRVNAK